VIGVKAQAKLTHLLNKKTVITVTERAREPTLIKVHKTKAKGQFLYINLHGFKDEEEQKQTYRRIKQMLKTSE